MFLLCAQNCLNEPHDGRIGTYTGVPDCAQASAIVLERLRVSSVHACFSPFLVFLIRFTSLSHTRSRCPTYVAHYNPLHLPQHLFLSFLLRAYQMSLLASSWTSSWIPCLLLSATIRIVLIPLSYTSSPGFLPCTLARSRSPCCPLPS
eukprot:6185480-Pleurochrysis_carterae.AAC.1